MVKLYLPALGGTPLVRTFRGRKIIYSLSNFLSDAQTLVAKTRMTVNIPGNRMFYNRAVSLSPTRNEIGFASATTDLGVDRSLDTRPDVSIADLSYNYPPPGTTGVEELLLAAIAEKIGYRLESVGSRITGYSMPLYTEQNCYVGLKGARDMTTNIWRVPPQVIEDILLNLDLRPQGDRYLEVGMGNGEGFPFIINRGEGSNVVWGSGFGVVGPAVGYAEKRSAAGLPATNLCGKCSGGPGSVHHWRVADVFAHGLHPALRFIEYDVDWTTVKNVGGWVHMLTMAKLLKEQRPRFAAFQNAEFDAFVTSLQTQKHGVCYWMVTGVDETPPDIYDDPKLADAQAQGADIGNITVAGKKLSAWRTQILASAPRSMFYRGVALDQIKVVTKFNATLDVFGVYSFTNAKTGLAMSLLGGETYMVGTVNGAAGETHITPIETQTGATVFSTGVDGEFSEPQRDAFNELNDLSKEMRWLYTFASSNGLREIANACWVLSTSDNTITVEQPLS